MEKEIHEKFSIEINLEKFVKKPSQKVYFTKKINIKKTLSQREVKKVYLVVSYEWESLIAACHELNIEVIELQHGAISKLHLGYSFPNISKIPYFPDKMLLFGEFWYDSVPLPIKKQNIIINGFNYHNSKVHALENIAKNNKQIIFISQGTIGKSLSEIAYDFAKTNQDFKIIYKLHPGEYINWQKKISSAS